jgi:secondary thiamine-phosphate synthase enzyme
MTVFQATIEVPTHGRGTTDLTAQIQTTVGRANITAGICQIFVHHTSASLLLTENADPDVHRDLEAFMVRAVPDGDPIYRHTQEGPDDMSAHVRSMLTQSGVSLPVGEGQCLLGTWQGIYLWEHRTAGHRRRLTVTVMGV